jgi:hypothetical protein
LESQKNFTRNGSKPQNSRKVVSNPSRKNKNAARVGTQHFA